jgi:hypothetical protein
MAYGVVYGANAVTKIPLARTKLPVVSIAAASGVVAAGVNNFVVQTLGLHQVDFDLNVSSPTNDTPYTIELYNETLGVLVQSRNAVAPQQAHSEDMWFGFEFTVANIAHQYAFYLTPVIGSAPLGAALLLQEINYRAVVQMFGGNIDGGGAAGQVTYWFDANTIVGDAGFTFDDVANILTVGGATRLAGTDAETFLELTDGDNVPLSNADEGRIRYNTTSQTFQFSENGGAWADLSGVGPGTINTVAKFTAVDAVGDSGITDDGTNVTTTENILIDSDTAQLKLGDAQSVGLQYAAAGVLAGTDGTDKEWEVGEGAAAFSKTDTSGVDVTLRARDGNGAGLNGGSLIFMPGARTGAGTNGAVQCPAPTGANSMFIGAGAGALNTGTANTGIGAGSALGTVAAGTDNTALGYAAGASTGAAIVGTVSIGSGANATAANAMALGAGAIANIAKTVNESGLSCARADRSEGDFYLNFGARTNIIYGSEIDVLGGAVDVTVTGPAGAHMWIEEVGFITTGLVLDGGAITVSPTVRAGITGTLAKYLAAVLTTLLTSEGGRDRYTTLLADDWETTFTAGMTVAGTIAGGGGSEAWTMRPYWVVRVLEDQP